jgi:DNA-binding HxlR family transcriptional regulator
MNSPQSKLCVKSLRLLADFWSLQIIESLSEKPQRYCELQRATGDMNPVTLTKKLHELEAAKLIVHIENPEQILYYKLTPLGHQATPVLQAIKRFSKLYEQQAKVSKKVAG